MEVDNVFNARLQIASTAQTYPAKSVNLGCTYTTIKLVKEPVKLLTDTSTPRRWLAQLSASHA